MEEFWKLNPQSVCGEFFSNQVFGFFGRFRQFSSQLRDQVSIIQLLVINENQTLDFFFFSLFFFCFFFLGAHFQWPIRSVRVTDSNYHPSTGSSNLDRSKSLAAVRHPIKRFVFTAVIDITNSSTPSVEVNLRFEFRIISGTFRFNLQLRGEFSILNFQLVFYFLLFKSFAQ